jgi:hypothetical protein
MKVTLLAWSGQIAASSSDQRKHQGHHRLDLADIYARDETLAALRVQLHVLQALAEGWRPRIAQERGLLHPLVEPTVSAAIPPDLAVEYVALRPWRDQKSLSSPPSDDEAGVPSGRPWIACLITIVQGYDF